jgi:tetratricopeptide (TPR) repeat protein
MQLFPAPRLIAVLLAAAMLSCAHAASDELTEAGRLLRAGKHEQAMARVDLVLAGDPGNPRARFLQGLIFAEEGKDDAAIDVFRKLTVDYPELPEPHNNLAVIYASRGEYDKARVALEQSIRTHPSYATAYENLGDVYAKLASQAYDKALRLDSSNAAAQNKLALVRDLVGDTGASTARATAPPPAAIAVSHPAPESPRATPAPAPAAAPAAASGMAPGKKATEVASAKPIAAATPEPSARPQEALMAVDAWAAAWSRQDVEAYLGAYADTFQVPGNATRESWEAQRRERVSGPKSISVTLDDPRVELVGERRARVTFQQHYRSDRFKSSARKTLLLGLSDDGRWRILEERLGR